MLRNHYNIESSSLKNDPFGHLPLIMGSILGAGIQSVHMIQAKH